MVRHEVS
jgi:hypothetical protein